MSLPVLKSFLVLCKIECLQYTNQFFLGTYSATIPFGESIALAVMHTLIGWLSTISHKSDSIAEVIVFCDNHFRRQYCLSRQAHADWLVEKNLIGWLSTTSHEGNSIAKVILTEYVPCIQLRIECLSEPHNIHKRFRTFWTYCKGRRIICKNLHCHCPSYAHPSCKVPFMGPWPFDGWANIMRTT